MKIRFSNTMEDIVAFNVHHLTHSPTMLRMLRPIAILSGVLFWLGNVLAVLAALAFVLAGRLPKSWSTCYGSPSELVQGGTNEQAKGFAGDSAPIA
jgi:hypothetical protein